MTVDDVIKLVDKGFTPEQILSLNLAGGGTIEKSPSDQQDEQTHQDPAEQKPAEPDENQQEIKALRAEIDELKKSIQADNIKTMSVNTLPTNAESVENILAGIIRPPYETNKTEV